MPASVTSAATRFASATFRASGFSHAMPLSSPLPRAIVSAISSTFATRAKFGPHSHTASIAGSATSWAMDGNAFARPTSSLRASAAVSSACFALGLQTPNTSASRTAWKACRWNRALNPLPMNPTPRRPSPMTCPVSPFPSVFDAELLQLLRRASPPFGHDHVAHVAEVLHAHLAGPEPRRRQVPERVEERDAGGERGFGPLGPCDIVEHGGSLGVRAGHEGLAVAIVALVVQPGEPAAHRGLAARLVGEHEVHELGDAGVGRAAGAAVAWDDEIDEQPRGLPFVWRKELGLVAPPP